MTIWTAYLLGFLGSLHCLGMCGPLAVALPPAGRTRTGYIVGRIIYNGGRILTYSLLGALFGLIGRTFVLAGAQRWLSLTIGLLIIVGVALTPRYKARLGLLNPIYRGVGLLKTALARLLHRHSTPALLLIGVLNGLLPCGLVYVALGGAAATGTPSGGAFYMMAFGAGTFPLMLAVSLSGRMLQNRFRINMQRAIPVALVSLALLFILRGLSLGIPYVSPILEQPHSCCHE